MKRIIALLTAILMMTLFAGCVDIQSQDEFIEDTSYTVQFEAFYDDNGERLFLLEETFEEEPQIVEYNNISFAFATPGLTIKEILEENYVASIEIVDDNGTFLGWMKYEYQSEIDEFGNDIGTFVKTDDTLYTTDEVLNMEFADCSLNFVAKWSDIDDAYYAESGY